MAHRRYGGQPPLHLPALAALARDPHPFIVVQKSAQVGLTELMVDRALWAADTGYAGRGNVLYAMPTQSQAEDFAQARFDRAIQDSQYYRSRLQPEPPRRKRTDSRRLKRVGVGYIYLRGSDSARQITSIDADVVLLDEFDQMAEGTLDRAHRRLLSSRDPRLLVASTPRYPEAGINRLFLQSDQCRYHLTCEHCELEQALTFESNVDLDDERIVCSGCRSALDVMKPGRWVPTAPGNEWIRGYHLSSLYSPWLDARSLIEKSRDDTPAALQEFQNSDLGEVFTVPGGGLSRDLLDRCRDDYSLNQYAGQPCFMGVDVGTKLHVVVRERVPQGSAARLWFADELDSFEKLNELMRRFHVRVCVVDAQPDIHATSQFALQHELHVWMAYYTRREAGHRFAEGGWERPNVCHLNRLQAIDETFERFRKQAVLLPRAARSMGDRVRDGIGEYYRELLAPQRTLEPDSTGNPQARWANDRRADHFAHAETYCWIASLIAAEVGIESWLVA